MQILKFIFSFFWVVPVEKGKSELSPGLEVVYSMGKKMLNSETANYSHGNLHTVFKFAIRQLEWNPQTTSNILVLGFGGGSIVKILREDYGYKNKILGVEHDPEVIRLYKKHFYKENHQPLDLILEDAYSFLLTHRDKYDLIFIDLFDDLQTIDMVYTEEFSELLKLRLQDAGKIVINTVEESDSDLRRTREFMLQLNTKFREVEQHRFQDLNRIILAK